MHNTHSLHTPNLTGDLQTSSIGQTVFIAPLVLIAIGTSKIPFPSPIKLNVLALSYYLLLVIVTNSNSLS